MTTPCSAPISAIRICSSNGQIALRREQIHLHRIKFIWDGACYERLLVRNFSDRPLRIRLALQYASDFADLFEVRGERRAARGAASAERCSDRKIALRYMGLDRLERVTNLEFDPAPQALTTARAAFEMTLKSNQARRIFVRVRRTRTGRWPVERPGVLSRHACRAARPARVERACGQHRQFQFGVQRDCAPLRCPTSTCWSPIRRRDPTPTPARLGSAHPSAATESSPRS